MKRQGGSIGFGVVLILLGVWLLLRASGVPLPGWDEAWPLLLMLGALSSLYNALRQDPRDTGGIWFGVTGLLAGALFLYITIGAGEWEDMERLWPAFPAAAGVGWLAAWLARPREVSNAIMGLIALAAGALGYLFTMGRLSASAVAQLASWWPLILIVIGIGYIIQYLVSRR